jgi:nitrate/TMAO reductase-like tetraheme cytochrome c subunit
MDSMTQPPSREGFLRRSWNFLWSPNARIPFLLVLLAGGIGGILFWGSFNWAMEMTNTEAFCTGCHEMRDGPYKELQQTIHFKNRSGVRAICSDCHVPHEWFAKIRRKIQASNELYHKVMGTIDTPEKFEKHRWALANNVWKSMKERDSLECRNCHSKNSMDPHKQKEASQIMFQESTKSLTCIDCHKGIAHKLPEDPEEAAENAEKK